MALNVIVGPPCAGKSTYVAENAADGDVIVDFDKIAQALGSNHPHEAPPAVKGAAFASRAAAIDHVISEGLDAWVIHTSPVKGAMERYREAGAEFVFLDPGIDECLERAKERPEWTAEAIRQWYGSPPDLDPTSRKAARKGGAMHVKTVPVAFKAGPDDGLEEGEFIVYPSTFTREPDSYGDVVAKGAFARGVAERKEAGVQLPGLFGHRMDDPDFFVAYAVEESEDDHGWRIKGKFDLDAPKARQTYRLVKGKRLRELSFAYDVREAADVELEDGRKAYELRDLEVFEFSFVPVGANRDTSVVAVKSAADALAQSLTQFKEGRVLAAKHIDSLRAAQEAIGNVIEAAEGSDQGKASTLPDAKTGASDEEPTVAKSSAPVEEPKAGPPAETWAALFTSYSAEVAEEGARS